MRTLILYHLLPDVAQIIVVLAMYLCVGMVVLFENNRPKTVYEQEVEVSLKIDVSFWNRVKSIVIRSAMLFVVFLAGAEFFSYFQSSTITLFENIALWMGVYAIIMMFFSSAPMDLDFSRYYDETKSVYEFVYLDISQKELEAFEKQGKERKKRYWRDLLLVLRKSLSALLTVLVLFIYIFVTFDMEVSSGGEVYEPYIFLGIGYVLYVFLVFLSEYFIGRHLDERRIFWEKSGKFFIGIGVVSFLFLGHSFTPYFILLCLCGFLYAWGEWQYNIEKIQYILLRPKIDAAWRKEIEELEQYAEERYGPDVIDDDDDYVDDEEDDEEDEDGGE